MDQTNHLILLADDDADDRLLMELSFETLEWGHKVKMVSSGEEAIDYLDALSPHYFPALIILDYHMPRLNGAATLKQIKSRHMCKDIPIVVYSTNMSVMLKEQLTVLGAFQCCHKPAQLQETLEMAKTFKRIAEDNRLTA